MDCILLVTAAFLVPLPRDPPKCILDAKIEVICTASALLKDYKENEVAADQEYKGKRLLVFGTIDKIGVDILGNQYLTFKTGRLEFRSVQCFASNRWSLAKLRPGDTVTVHGECDGLMMNVLVNDCEFFTSEQEVEIVRWLAGMPSKKTIARTAAEVKERREKAALARKDLAGKPESKEKRAAAMLTMAEKLEGDAKAKWLKKLLQQFPETAAGKKAAALLKDTAAGKKTEALLEKNAPDK